MSTVYITEPGVQIHKKGQRLLATKGEEILLDIPIIKIDRLVLMGSGVSVTTPALHALARKNIDILYLTQRGGFVSRVSGREHKHSQLRHAQSIAVSNSTLALKIAKRIVEGKIHNQRVLTQRHVQSAHWATNPLQSIDDMHKRLDQANSLDEVRGLEGMAARNYFALLRKLFHAPKDGPSWHFDRRAYYPPTDPINALLSFGYTLLLNDLIAACQIVGLDPDWGFFHSIDYGKPSMALDIEEEFRPIIVDSIVLMAINRPIFSLQDFKASQPKQISSANDNRPITTPVLMNDDARNRFISLYENRLAEQVFYPPEGQTTTYRRILELQAYQMARVILGETSTYSPMTVR